jgi:hypothetical protein
MSYAGNDQDEMKGEGKNSVAGLVVGNMTVAVEQDSKEARPHDHPSRPRRRLLLLLSPVNDGKHDCAQVTAYFTIEQHRIESRHVSYRMSQIILEAAPKTPTASTTHVTLWNRSLFLGPWPAFPVNQSKRRPMLLHSRRS